MTMTNTKVYKLLELIKKAFPELVWSSYKYIDEGWDHQVIILDDNIVFRFPTDEDYADKLGTEIKVLDYLQSFIKTPTPQYIYLPKPLSFAGYQIVKGETLTKAVFDNLSLVDQQLVAVQLADFLTALQGLYVEQIPMGKVEVSMLAEDQAVTKTVAEQHLKTLLTLEDWNMVQAILTETDSLIASNNPKTFIHNDVYSRHLLWDVDEHQVGVIDFSDMTIGDPAIDFSEIHEYGFEFVRTVYDTYKGPKDKTFLSRAWTYQKWAAVYMLTDYFEYQKTTFEVARETFDRIKAQQKEIS